MARAFFPKKQRGLPVLDNRESTDSSWCTLFIVAFILSVLPLVLVLAWGAIRGEWYVHPGRLMHGMDYKGELCGHDAAVANQRFLYFCGSKATQANGLPQQIDFNARVCVESCPTSGTNMTVQCLRPAISQYNEVAQNATYQGVYYKNVYELDVLQTVEVTQPYPSEQFLYYCLPQDTWLRDQVLYGPVANKSPVSGLAASVWQSWLVIIVACVFSAILCMCIFYCLGHYGGAVIACTFVLQVIVLAILALFFFIAPVFPSSDGTDDEYWYTALNPIVHSIWGWPGKILSFLFGIVLALVACVFFAAFNTVADVDKQMVPIWVALQCVESKEVLGVAFVQVGILIAWFLLMFAGLVLICSIGYVDRMNLVVNEENFEGIQASFKWFWWQPFYILYYLLFSYWCFEVQIGVQQFTVTYAAVLWYFRKNTLVRGQGTQQVDINTGGANFASGRLSGMDGAPVEREGAKFKAGGNQEFVIMGVGKAGPGKKDILQNTPVGVIIKNKDSVAKTFQGGEGCEALCVAIRSHFGSIAKSRITIAIYRIPASIYCLIRAAAPRGWMEDRKNVDDEGNDREGAIKQLVRLILAVLEQLVGGNTPKAYAAITLNDIDWDPATKDVYESIEEAGGVLAYFYSCCDVYEIVIVGLVASVSAWVADIILKNQWLNFSPTMHKGTVIDTWSIVLICFVFAGLVTYSYIGTFSLAIDTIFYTFGWSRNFLTASDKDGNGDAFAQKNYCPPALQDMLKAEMEEAPDVAIAKGALAGGIKIGKRMQAPSTHAKNTMMSLFKTVNGSPVPEQERLLSTAPPR